MKCAGRLLGPVRLTAEPLEPFNPPQRAEVGAILRGTGVLRCPIK